jgi:hypothetical protein
VNDGGRVYDDSGAVIEGDREFSEVAEDATAPTDPDPVSTMACPEVKNPATYTDTKERAFITDKGEPFSSWLKPNQTAEYTTEKQHEIGASVTVGVSAEAGAFLLHAASKLDITVSYKFTVKKNIKVTDTNRSNKDYRVRLGNQGWRIKQIKHWVAPPCNPKSQVTWDVTAPEPGDISLGRFNS